jgi:hypothetical protein
MNKVWGIISLVIFILGLILAVVGGLIFPNTPWVGFILAVFGLVIGIIHINAKEINTLLLATIAVLAMAAAFAPITVLDIGKYVGSIIIYFAALMAPVAIIAAIKALIILGLKKEVE